MYYSQIINLIINNKNCTKMKKLVLIDKQGNSITLRFKNTIECMNHLQNMFKWYENLDKFAQINIINEY